MKEGTNQKPSCLIYPLEPRKIIKKSLSITIILFFLVFIWIATLVWSAIQKDSLFYQFTVNIWSAFLFFIIIIEILVVIYQYYYYKFYYYDLGKDLVVIRKGVIGRTEATTSYSKIQNIYVDQDILDRLFNLYDVHIITAGVEVGTTKPLNHIDGLNKQNVESIKNELLKKAKINSRKEF